MFVFTENSPSRFNFKCRKKFERRCSTISIRSVSSTYQCELLWRSERSGKRERGSVLSLSHRHSTHDYTKKVYRLLKPLWWQTAKRNLLTGRTDPMAWTAVYRALAMVSFGPRFHMEDPDTYRLVTTSILLS